MTRSVDDIDRTLTVLATARASDDPQWAARIDRLLDQRNTLTEEQQT